MQIPFTELPSPAVFRTPADELQWWRGSPGKPPQTHLKIFRVNDTERQWHDIVPQGWSGFRSIMKVTMTRASSEHMNDGKYANTWSLTLTGVFSMNHSHWPYWILRCWRETKSPTACPSIFLSTNHCANNVTKWDWQNNTGLQDAWDPPVAVQFLNSVNGFQGRYCCRWKQTHG